MKPKIYFVSGVCGVGKSAVIPYLKSQLPNTKYDVRDFDERGVPDGADRVWRISELVKWLEVAALSAQRGVSTIVCGFAKPKDFEGLSLVGIPEIELIILDAKPEIIRKRLEGRYSKNGVFDETQKVTGRPVNDFIRDNVYYCNIMREECTAGGCKIIDTSTLIPEEVSKRIVDLISA